MAELRSSAFTVTAAIAAIGIAVRSLSGGGGADPAAHTSTTVTAAAKDAPGAVAPERLVNMGSRLLAESQGDTSHNPRLHSRGATELGVTVVTIPDPVDSHEDWAYDANLEAIRRAHEDERYAVDRMWLPWASGGDSLLTDSAKTRVRRAFPGVILFRSADTLPPTAARPRYRLVYLVGEVPTTGVHAAALIHALAERDLLLGRYAFSPGDAPGGRDTLHLLGPTFSGSAPGLAAILENDWVEGDSARTVRVITGSATGTSNQQVFSRRPFSFAATVNSDEALRSALAGDVLSGLGIDTGELAVLIEGSTAYGRDWRLAERTKSALSSDSAARKTGGQGRGGAPATAPKAAGADARSAGLKGALFLSFPMNIGTLRDEYADRLRDARRAQQQEATAGPSVSLTDGARPMETAPVASRLTASAVDLTLDEIAATLRSHDIRAVAIAASDVRDRLFLVSELRTRLRDVQFIALENNALYLTPEYNRDLRGMLVMSSYPLVAETQLWGGGHEVVPFAGEFAEGVYNAALLHLGSRRLLDYAYPDPRLQVRRPPVWMSVVGSGALIPLRADTAGLGYATQNDSAAIPEAAPEPRFDFLSGVLMFVVLAAAGWLLYAVFGHAAELATIEKMDGALLKSQLDALAPTLAAERARRSRRVRLGGFLPFYGGGATTAATNPAPATTKEGGAAAAVAEAAPDAEDARIRPILSRYADWATLRCQEALYRFLFAGAALGGLVPGMVLFAAATVRAGKGLPMWTMAASAAVLATSVAMLARWVLQAGRGEAVTRRFQGFFSLIVLLLGVVSLFGMAQVASRHAEGTGWRERWAAGIAAAPDDWVRAGAVVTAAGAILVLLAALARALSSLSRSLAQYRVALSACNRRNAGLNLWRANVWVRHALLALGLAYVALTLAYAAEIAGAAAGEPVRFTLLFHRGWRVDGGMSPILPLGLAALACAAWARWHLRRIRALRQVTAFEAVCLARVPAAGAHVGEGDPDAAEWESAFPRRAVEGVRQVRERLTRLVPDTGSVVLAVVLLAAAACIVLTRYHSMERVAGMRWFDGLYRFGMIAMVSTTAWGVYRLLAVWSGLHRTLRAVSGTPLVTAFERLPRRISRLTRLVFLGTPRSAVVAPVAAAQWRHLKSLSVQLDPDLLSAGAAPRQPDPVFEAPRSHLVGDGMLAEPHASHGAVALGGEEDEQLTADEVKLRRALRGYIVDDGAPATGLGDWGQEAGRAKNLAALGTVLEAFWIAEPRSPELKGVARQVEEHGGDGESGPSTSGRIRRTTGDVTALWFRAAEEFAAVQVVDYIEAVINQMRVLALFIFASLILVTLHEGAYPYQPQSLLKLILFALLAGTVGALVKVMLEMNRDEILSRIAHTEPGKVTWDMHFVLNLAVFGLVPVISLIGSEFPSVREFLLGWMPTVARLLGGGG